VENSSIAFKSEDRYELHFGLVRAGLSIKGIVETRDMLSISFDNVLSLEKACSIGERSGE
jgi:hypothetical protein